MEGHEIKLTTIKSGTLTTTTTGKNLLIGGNGHIFHAASAYNMQLRHWVDMALDSNLFDTIYVICFAFHLQPGFDAMSFNEYSSKMGNKKEIFQVFDWQRVSSPKIKFISSPYRDFPCMIEMDHINTIITRHKISLLCLLIDLGPTMQYINGKKFACPSLLWHPNHYLEHSKHTKERLTLFDRIITLCPSSEQSLVKTLAPQPFNMKPHQFQTIPHVIEFEAEILKTKCELRTQFNINQDDFVILMNGGQYEQSNRKSYDIAIQVFSQFYDRTGGQGFLWIHCTNGFFGQPNRAGHIHCLDMIQLFEKRPEVQKRIKVTTDVVDRLTLQKIYKCADVILVSSKSEGFCLPVLEAQSQGIPVVTTKFMAMGDYNLNGIAVPYDQLSYNGFENCWWIQPSVSHLTQGLIDIYKWSATTRKQNATLGIEMVKSKMSYSAVFQQFNQLFIRMLALDDKRRLKLQKQQQDQLVLQQQQSQPSTATTATLDTPNNGNNKKFSQIPIIINGPINEINSISPMNNNNNNSGNNKIRSIPLFPQDSVSIPSPTNIPELIEVKIKSPSPPIDVKLPIEVLPSSLEQSNASILKNKTSSLINRGNTPIVLQPTPTLNLFK